MSVEKGQYKSHNNSKPLFRNMRICGLRQEDQKKWKEHGTELYQALLPWDAIPRDQQALVRRYTQRGSINIGSSQEGKFSVATLIDQLILADDVDGKPVATVGGIYELFVGEPEPGVRKRPVKDSDQCVYVGKAKGFLSRLRKYLSSGSHIATLFATALLFGKSIWVRVCYSETPEETEKHMLMAYKYAWNRQENDSVLFLREKTRNGAIVPNWQDRLLRDILPPAIARLRTVSLNNQTALPGLMRIIGMTLEQRRAEFGPSEEENDLPEAAAKEPAKEPAKKPDKEPSEATKRMIERITKPPPKPKEVEAAVAAARPSGRPAPPAIAALPAPPGLEPLRIAAQRRGGTRFHLPSRMAGGNLCAAYRRDGARCGASKRRGSPFCPWHRTWDESRPAQ